MSEHAHQVEPLIDVEAAASILGMSPDWIFQEAAAGRLPSYKIGRARNSPRRFRASELEAFIQGFAQGKMASVTTLGDRRR